jgi:hypothetical protein
MPKADSKELTQLKAFCICVIDFLMGKHGLADRDGYVRAIDRTTSLRGIRTVVSDVLEWAQDVNGDSLAELDARLSASTLPTLTLMRARGDSRLAAILARGRVTSADEYRFIHALLADVESKLPRGDRALAEGMLASFQAQKSK